MEESNTPPAIGIDLGTTHSCVAVWQHGRVEVIPNDHGNRTTPSCVSFTQTDRFTGDAAFNQLITNPCNTIFDAKRLIGREFDDELMQKDMILWPFKVDASPCHGTGKKPVVAVTYKGEQRKFAAKEISAMVLMKMKEVAEAYVGSAVKNAVVTVPAYFNNLQRQATKDAATIAGLSGVQIINEPTASAFAYGLAQKPIGSNVVRRNVLVIDLGGGTYDVALVTFKKDVIRVKSVSGDTHLGGGDFDIRMVRHFAAEFEEKHHKDLSRNPRAMARLRTACERAKRNLSSTSIATIEIDCLLEGTDFSSTITRAQFENLNLDLFEECIKHVKKCLKDAKMVKGDVDDVVLVGGSSRIPKVQQLLQDFFCGKELYKSINPDETVACGAAIYAASLSCFDDNNLRLVDVTPLSIGVKVHLGRMAVVIPRNSPIPTRMEKIFTTSRDYKTRVYIPVHQGETLEASDTNFLCELKLSGIPQAQKHIPRIKVFFKIDADGILHYSSQDLMTGNKIRTIPHYHSGRLSRKEVWRMVKDAEKFKVADKQYQEKVKAMNSLETYTQNMATMLECHGAKVGLRERRKMGVAINQTIQWLDQNLVLAEGCKFEEKMIELEGVCGPIIKKMLETQNSSTSSNGASGSRAKIEIIKLDLD